MQQDPVTPTRTSTDSAIPEFGGFAPTIQRLSKLRRSARLLMMVQRLAWLLAGVLVVAILAGLVDFLLRWPRELRVFLWSMTAGTLVVWGWRLVVGALRFSPSLTQIALRLESADPTLRGWLASGVELSQGLRAPDAASAIADRAATAGIGQAFERAVVAEAADRVARARVWSILRRDRAYRGLGTLAAILIGLFLLTLVDSERMAIGARRVITPWSRIDWPKRTGVVNATGVTVHPLGTALALRAGLTKSDRPPEDTRVWASFRLKSHGRELANVRRLELTHQNRPVDPTNLNTGTLFERLVEPAGLNAPTGGSGQSVSAADELTLEYWFESEDDRSSVASVLLVEPPQVVSAEARITPPSYTRLQGTGAVASDERAIDLGAGNDERANPGIILAGSQISLRITLNKGVPTPSTDGLPLEGERAARWAGAALGEPFAEVLRGAAVAALTGHEQAAPRVAFESDGRIWTVTWRLDQAARLSVHAVDEHEIASVEESLYAFDVQKDESPTASIIQPGEDRAVLATAMIDVLAEARDDVGLTGLRLDRQQARRPAGSAGAPVEPLEQPAEFASSAPPSSDPASAGSVAEQSRDTRRLEVAYKLDLSTMDLRPGDEVWLTAVASDAYALDDQKHEPVRSIPRKLRIMSRQELVEQVWAELAGLRRTAITLEEDQRQAQQELAKGGAADAAKAARSQSGLGERIARQEESVARAERQLQANQLEDPNLQRLLDEARKSIHSAASASGEASRSASAADQQQSAASDQNKTEQARTDARAEAEKQAQETTEAQQRVRDELANLAEMLDQGQDTWASKRSIERLIEEQKRLKERTAQAGARTGGRTQDELSAEEKAALRELAGEQRAAAEKVREAVEKMQQRQEQMKRSDPASAQGMQQAAERARQEGVQDRMQQASEQIQQNQTSNAQQQQQRASDALEQMLKDLDQAAQNKDQVLRRFLANLMDAIQSLVDRQKTEIQALLDAESSGDDRRLEGLDRGMAELHQSTLGVIDEAANGPRQTQGLARIIERAATAQQSATTALRDRPINSDEALDQEQTSLKRLQDALRDAEETDEQAEEREEARQRSELKQKYTQTLERQIVIRDGTSPLVGAESNRRTRNSARLLGQDQEALRAQMQELASSTADLKEAKVFEFAHKRLDSLMSRAATTLNEGTADAGVVSRQAASVRILQSVIDALDGRKKKRNAFRENEQGGGGGGQGGGQSGKGLPPAAELKLLRALQDEAMAATRELSERAAATGGRAADAAEVAEAAALQRALAEQARDLLKRVSQQGAGPGAPGAMPEGGEGGVKVVPPVPDPVEERPDATPEPNAPAEPTVPGTNPAPGTGESRGEERR